MKRGKTKGNKIDRKWGQLTQDVHHLNVVRGMVENYFVNDYRAN